MQELPAYTIIEGSMDWADKYREFCRQSYVVAYPRPELGITADLFSKEVFESERIKEYFRQKAQRTNEHRSWLAIDKNQNLLGVVAAHRYPDYCEMQSFYVKPEYKGHGIGHDLYQKVLSFANGDEIRADVVEYMTETINKYRHWGFEIDKSKGSFTYDLKEWPPEAVKNYRAIYMVKPSKH